MKTSTVLKKARKLIEKPENWEGSKFNKSPPGTITYTFVIAIQEVIGECYFDANLSFEEQYIINDFSHRMSKYTHHRMLHIMDRLIWLALERGM